MIFFVLLCLLYPRVNSSIGKLQSQKVDDVNFIATISGLGLAGAIAGYIQFSFKNTRAQNGRPSLLHLLLGHIATALNLLVIGFFLLVSAECVGRYFNTQFLKTFPLCVAWVLYAAMVVYDIYDLASFDPTK